MMFGLSGAESNSWDGSMPKSAGSSVETFELKGAALPPAVAAFISAVNSSDFEGIMEAFAEDALVNDQLREFWGSSAIRDWAAREIIADKLTLCVVKAVHNHGNCVVTTHVDGTFDKRGLPEPLVLTFYFCADEDKVVQLIILRNRPNV
jgi:ketosteroid isomerase-like protein